jgi:hypothetical protein
MGSTLIKLASNCVLSLLKDNLGLAVGSTQFSVETKGGCDQLQWTLQMVMESNCR